MGYFYRAQMIFNDTQVTRDSMWTHLAQFEGDLKHEWKVCNSYIAYNIQYRVLMCHTQGIPELYNEGGTRCDDACQAQAWSSACILDAIASATRPYHAANHM